MSKEREMIDLVRSIMYAGTGGKDDNDNTFYDEVCDLANKLSKYDGVVCDPFKNRLIQMMDELKKNEKVFHHIEHLNDD